LEAWRNERLLYERTPGSVMPSVRAVALNLDFPTPEVPRKRPILDKTQFSLVDSSLASKRDCTTLEVSDRKTFSDKTQHQHSANFQDACYGNLDTVKTPEMEMHAIVLSPHKAQSAAIPAFARGILHCLQGELCFVLKAGAGSGVNDEVVLSAGDMFVFHGDERTIVISPRRKTSSKINEHDAKFIWVDVTVPVTRLL